MQFSISLSQPVGEIHLRCNAKVLFDVSTKHKKKNLFSFASGENTGSDPLDLFPERNYFFKLTLLADIVAVCTVRIILYSE